MNPRDLPEVVAELIIEMHEVRLEISALNGRVDRLERVVENGFRELREEQRAMREEMRDNTNRLIEAFGRSMEPLINRVLDHKNRLNSLEKPQ